MKFITYIILFGAIALSESSIIPSYKDIYLLDKPSSNVYISLLPMENRIEKEPKELNILRQQMDEVMKSMCEQDVKSGEMASDWSICVIKTVTSFIGCMHVDTDLKDTAEADFLKCLSQALSVFVKCLVWRPESAVLDKYSPNVVMHEK
ncbi:uncharacterized protein LOC125237771 [Leguminivora glycinivorella]|uniref:uncharacterized protein LOC125237771 n=1 Tax=Leguminivora glycinivorella TaxID=1035111 RepID=UPI0020100B7B|nr:uncharacterized protein LOC125237771 [Leguminivora glycinivorella]